MACADNFCTRQQQLYKNPFSSGEHSLACLRHNFFKFYIFGLSRHSAHHIFRMAKATDFKFGELIDQVSTNQKNEIYP